MTFEYNFSDITKNIDLNNFETTIKTNLNIDILYSNFSENILTIFTLTELMSNNISDIQLIIFNWKDLDNLHYDIIKVCHWRTFFLKLLSI